MFISLASRCKCKNLMISDSKYIIKNWSISVIISNLQLTHFNFMLGMMTIWTSMRE